MISVADHLVCYTRTVENFPSEQIEYRVHCRAFFFLIKFKRVQIPYRFRFLEIRSSTSSMNDEYSSLFFPRLNLFRKILRKIRKKNYNKLSRLRSYYISMARHRFLGREEYVRNSQADSLIKTNTRIALLYSVVIISSKVHFNAIVL